MRAKEFIVEYRDRLLQYVKSLLPTWPEYVLKDWLVPNKGNFSNLPTDAVKNGIMEKIQLANLSVNTKWQLVPDMKFTMDMFEPMSKQRLIGRAGGNSDMGLDVPRDKERHATQAALAQQQGGVRKEPVLLIKSANGYELLEGWHRTIQHFVKYPNGYTGPAYVAVAQGQQDVSEGAEVKSHDFMAGHCHVMALALKQLHPDWQIRAHVGYDDDEADDTEYRVDHVYTVAPDGTAYDCRGRFDNEQQLVGPDTTGGVDTQYVNFGPEEIKQAIQRGELKRFTKQDLANAMQAATQAGKQDVAEGFSNAVTFFRGEPILSQERLNQLKSSIGKPYPILRKEGSAANIGTYMSPDGDKATNFVKQALAGQGKGGVVTQIQVNPNSFSKGDGGIDEAVIITNIAGLVSNQTPNKNDPLRIQDRKQAMLKYLGPGVKKYLNDPLLSDPKIVQSWYNPEFAQKNWNTINSGKQAVTKPGESNMQERMMRILGPLAENIRQDPQVINYFISHNPGDWVEYNFRMNSDGSGTKVVDVKYYPPAKQGVAEGLTEYKNTPLQDYNGLQFMIDSNHPYLRVEAFAPGSGQQLAQVDFKIDDQDELHPEDLHVEERWRGQGIAQIMYDFVKSQGYTIHRSWSQTDAGSEFWNKHRGQKRVWEQGVAESENNDTAISLSKLGKFHPGADSLAEFVPERATARYALHPDKWESTFYSLTNKDSDKLKYYGPKKISIPPGTLVGDMAIANKFYRAKTPEEKQQYAELYKASLQPYPVDVSEYRMPELLIPKQGVAEGKQPGKSVTDAILKVMPIAQEIWFHGSRATRSHRKNSDTDILVIVPDDLVGNQYLGAVRILQKLSSIFDNYDIQPTKAETNIHRIAQEEGRLLWSNKQAVAENFADGRNPQDKGDSVRHGIPKNATMAELEKASHAAGRKGQLARWQLNMRRGKKKTNETVIGTLHFPKLIIAVDDHAIDRTRTRGISPATIDQSLRKLNSIADQLGQMESSNTVWVYDVSNNLALGLRRTSSRDMQFTLKTVVADRPYDGTTPIIELTS